MAAVINYVECTELQFLYKCISLSQDNFIVMNEKRVTASRPDDILSVLRVSILAALRLRFRIALRRHAKAHTKTIGSCLYCVRTLNNRLFLNFTKLGSWCLRRYIIEDAQVFRTSVQRDGSDGPVRNSRKNKPYLKVCLVGQLRLITIRVPKACLHGYTYFQEKNISLMVD
ncbi:hypothetical protein EVAR_58567_1 [Eumeta japonica]|uniref:Uncharacterized protein n=1 Tax=Eumeta variegata TaxID=151549 RepID=A0A4C1Z233_EUMVA|nr:hypothetical protein EVAR_58567_1 [Eumeta japonica]